MAGTSTPVTEPIDPAHYCVPRAVSTSTTITELSSHQAALVPPRHSGVGAVSASATQGTSSTPDWAHCLVLAKAVPEDLDNRGSEFLSIAARWSNAAWLDI